MRIILFNSVKYSVPVKVFCLCALTFMYSMAAQAETLSAPPSSNHAATNVEQPKPLPINNLDWVKKEYMTPEQQVSVAKYCCGAYLEPVRDYPGKEQHPDDASLHVSALSTEAQGDSTALLEGDVNISQGYRQVRSDSAIVDQKNRQIKLDGNVRFREPNMLVIGDHALLDLDSEEVQLENATYVLHEASVRGSAKTLRRQSDGIIIIEDSSFSGCAPSDTTWQLQTSEIKLDQVSGFATVKNARLDVGNVPVFYFPYAKFPISERRSSGLLFPIIASDQENGLDISQPLYLNLAPNYDATLTPRYIQHRGAGIEVNYRYLRHWATTEFTASFIENDKGGNQEYEPKALTGLHPNQGEDRYMMHLQHKGNFSPSWSSMLNVNQVSDKNYFSDIGQIATEENSPTHLSREGSIDYQTDYLQFSIEAQDFQSITAGLDDPFRVASKISLNGHYRYANAVTIDIKNQQAEFKHDDLNQVTGGRTTLDYSLGLDKRWGWGYLKPKIGLRHLDYQLNSPNLATQVSDTLDNRSVTVPFASVDSSIVFEKQSALFSGFRQTLEPRLFYVRSKFRAQQSLPDFDTKEITPSYAQLFNDRRFVGGDRISDDHRLSLGLSTSFIHKKTGQEKFRASLAQAIYLDDRKVSLLDNAQNNSELVRDKSDLALKLKYRINDQWRMDNEIVYNNNDKYWESGFVSLYYNDPKDRLFNLSYRYSRLDSTTSSSPIPEPQIEQVDLSFYLPLGNDFNWVGRWHHDFTNNRELELFTGFEYNNCCWRAGLVIRRWLDRQDDLMPERKIELKNGVFLQVQFKGLAGTGGRLATILKRGIYGYEPVEKF